MILEAADRDDGVADGAEDQLDRVLTFVLELQSAEGFAGRSSEVMGDWINAFGTKLRALLCSGSSRYEEAFDVHERTKSTPFLTALADSASPAEAAIPADLRERADALRRAVRALAVREGQVADMRRLTRTRAALRVVEDEIVLAAPEVGRWRNAEPASSGEVANYLRERCGEPTAAVSIFTDSDSTTAFVLRSDSDSSAWSACPSAGGYGRTRCCGCDDRSTATRTPDIRQCAAPVPGRVIWRIGMR